MTGPIEHRPTRGSGLTDRFDWQTSAITQCIGKHGFDSRAAAERVIAARKRSAKGRNGKKQAKSNRASLQAYRCKHCKCWHIAGGMLKS